MNIDTFKHAIKLLIEKKEEFEVEINFVNDEIKELKKNYINENAEFKIGDTVNYKPEKNYHLKYIVESIDIKDEIFTYDIISFGNDFHRMGKFAPKEKQLKKVVK